MDGWDEVLAGFKTDTVICKLIRKRQQLELHNSSLIHVITSRPTATATLKYYTLHE